MIIFAENIFWKILIKDKSMFSRDIEQNVLDNLQKSDLWTRQLKRDCEEQKVFMTIRPNDVVSFYHYGGKVFSFEKKAFRTHIKYAAVIEKRKKSSYLTENDLNNKVSLISVFSDDQNYKRIKENCKQYSKKTEEEEVSKIYHAHSYLSGKDIVVLDIEISFEGKNKIDILLYNKVTKTLKFIEAKHFSNSEIWSETIPKVVSQIRKYEEQIQHKKVEIIEAYKKYINTINEMFEKSIPPPEMVENEVTLLIFGFDSDQRNGRLQKLIFENESFVEHKVYCAGSAKNANLNALWNK